MIKVTTLWLVNEQGEILLAQRAHRKENDPGVWGPSVTGRLGPDEDFEAALLREVEEELALKPADYDPHFLLEQDFDHPDGESRKFRAYYAVIPKAKTSDIHIQESEVEGVAWFSIAHIEAWMKSGPAELVPSADDVWPQTFQALKDAKVV